jgi:hypothetical protein
VSDTSPEIERMASARYARMDPVERLLIGVSMFETARTIVLASFPPDLTPAELRWRLCERLYPGLAIQAYGRLRDA